MKWHCYHAFTDRSIEMIFPFLYILDRIVADNRTIAEDGLKQHLTNSILCTE